MFRRTTHLKSLFSNHPRRNRNKPPLVYNQLPLFRKKSSPLYQMETMSFMEHTLRLEFQVTSLSRLKLKRVE